MAKHDKQPFESTLQDLVYSVDIGLGYKIIRTTLFCIFAIIVMGVFTARQFRGLNTEAAMDYAQLGRNVAESNRYVTKCVRPVSMAQVSDNTFDGDARIMAHPELFRAPLYPVILAGTFKFFDMVGVNLFPSSGEFQGRQIYPAEQWVIVPLHHFFTFLSGLLIYLLGRRLFSQKIGLLGVTTYFFSNMVWQDSINGTAIPIVGFFVLGAVYFSVVAMNHRREHRAQWNWLLFYGLSILFSAAAFLTHYAAVTAIAGVALFILLMGSKTQRGGHLVFFYLALVFLLVLPWLVRNVQLSGSPLGMAVHTALADTSKYPGDALMRTMTPSFNLISDYAAVRSKWAANFNEFYTNNLTSLGGGMLVAFFAVTFFYRFVRVHVHTLRWGLGLAIVLLFVGIGCFGQEAMVLYHIFWPFVILYGLAFFFILLDRLDLGIQLYKTGLTVLVIGLSALPLLVTILLSPPSKLPYPPYYSPFVMRVCELLRPTEIICTDMPWATAWYGNRVSILLPETLDDYYEINDYRKYISGLYITTLTKDRPFISSLLDGPNKTWLPIVMGKLPDDFPLKQGFPLNKNDQLFLTDSVRWGGTQAAPEKAAGEEAE